ncbi:MAG: glycerate kinase [Chloroflexaceae bacterium]|nr:glycerate kinase [Chloroflexaceae bacterium]
MNPFRVVIAPSGFKESLSAEDVSAAIARGVKAAHPTAETICLPLADGGEGFSQTLVGATGGTLYPVRVSGPVGQMVETHIGILGGNGPRTAVLEMSAAAGLRLVPRDMRNPLLTTTYGVGQLIKAALNLNVSRILIGCGDSGTNDGGAGMVQALGGRLLQADGTLITHGGLGLNDLDRIDLSDLDPRLKQVQIDVACNPHVLLCGPQGVARVFGPQKGASPEMVDLLEKGLERYAAVIQRDLGLDVRTLPGCGASGGLGTGLLALLGATLHPRYEIVMQYLDLDSKLRHADLVLTAEGGIDFQTPRGKIPAEVARRARRYGVPVIALAGTIGKDAEINYQHNIAAYSSILQAPCTLDEAITRAAELTASCAENAVRMVLTGRRIAERQQRSRNIRELMLA